VSGAYVESLMLVHLQRLPLLCFSCLVLAYQSAEQQSQTIQLTVPAGTPLRVYLTKRMPKRLDAPVEAKTISPVYAFDRETIPAGARLIGHVSLIQPVSKSVRTRAILAGDFTPLHVATVEFTAVQLPDGRMMPIQTVASAGLNTLYPLRPPKPASKTVPQQKSGAAGATQQAKDQVAARIDAVKNLPALVRSPGKMERLEDYFVTRLPYHPQYVRNRTRFDAELAKNLDFGPASIPNDSLALLGTQPANISVVPARLLTPVHSGETQKGQVVEAVTSKPLFSADKRLILPEGTLLDGSVVNVKKAGWFHHAGQLRLTFREVKLSPETQALASAVHTQEGTATLVASFHTQATLSNAEASGAAVKVNGEGGVQAKESNTRFINVGVAALVSRSAGTGDRTRGPNGVLSAPSRNVGGNILGGGLGFGLLGSAASQASPNVGMAFAYYGLAWSVYSNVIAKGHEVDFDKNTAIDVGFNARAAPAGAAQTQAAANH
jgi:hypothetical protein